MIYCARYTLPKAPPLIYFRILKLSYPLGVLKKMWCSFPFGSIFISFFSPFFEPVLVDMAYSCVFELCLMATFGSCLLLYSEEPLVDFELVKSFEHFYLIFEILSWFSLIFFLCSNCERVFLANKMALSYLLGLEFSCFLRSVSPLLKNMVVSSKLVVELDNEVTLEFLSLEGEKPVGPFWEEIGTN